MGLGTSFLDIPILANGFWGRAPVATMEWFFHHNSEGRINLGISSLGRYQVRGVLGRETMGIVDRGYDPVLDRGQVDTSQYRRDS